MTVFVYTIDNFTYLLKPVFRLNSTKHIRIVGAELHGRGNGKYYGYWSRENMPMNLVYRLEGWCRMLYAQSAYDIDEDGYMRGRAME